MTCTLPEYLKNEYVVCEGEHLEILESYLAWCWCSWSILKENILAERKSVAGFLETVKKCKTSGEIKKLINPYI